MNNEVKFAVIPCAGKGTRFLPITKGVPKEMLNIVDKPTLDYIVDEVISAGITNIVFIVNDEKEDIKKYYDRNIALENDLIEHDKKEYADLIKHIATKANYFYVTQKEQLGLGHAVLQAKEIIGNNNFVVCCGDDITLFDKVSPIKTLIDAFNKTNATIVGGQKVEHKYINRYGCMDIEEDLGNGLFALKGIVEKPDLDKAPSNYGSLGKWILKSNIFDELEHTKKGKGGEIQLTDAIASLMKKEKVYYQVFEGCRYDCGDKFGFLKAVIDTSLANSEIREDLINYIKNLKI